MKNTGEFDNWTDEELFYFLQDLGVIPYEEEAEKWHSNRDYMIYMCEQTYERSRSTQ